MYISHTRRAKNIDEQAIEKIISILDGWTGKLSWELLIDAISGRIYSRYTRQALSKHDRIKQAFALRKKKLSGSDNQQHKIDSSSPELKLSMQYINRLEVEIERLKLENNNLLEQFLRWAYNAHTRGLDQDFLNQPLGLVQRDASKITKLNKRS